MGRAVCAAVTADPDLELVAAVDPAATDLDLGAVCGGAAPRVSAAIDAIGTAGAEVAVDFTVATQALANLRWCAAHGVHTVIGTTGIDPAALAEVAAEGAAAGLGCVAAANFAIGAVLMMRFAALAAPYMDSVEIIELHHDAKIDAPSGTALRTAEEVSEARRRSGRGPWPPDRTTTGVAGARGASWADGVRIHSVRLPGLVAHQEVILGAVGQSLTLRHDAYDRTSFMPGVILAVKAVASRPGLTLGLEALLGL